MWQKLHPLAKAALLVLTFLSPLYARAQTTTTSAPADGAFVIDELPTTNDSLLGRIALDTLVAAIISLAFLAPIFLNQTLTLVKVAPPRTSFIPPPTGVEKQKGTTTDRHRNRGSHEEEEDEGEEGEGDSLVEGCLQIGSYYHGSLAPAEDFGRLRSEYVAHKHELKKWKKKVKKFERYQQRMQSKGVADSGKIAPEHPGDFHVASTFVTAMVSTMYVTAGEMRSASNLPGGALLRLEENVDDEDGIPMHELGASPTSSSLHHHQLPAAIAPPPTTAMPLRWPISVTYEQLSLVAYCQCPVDENVLPNARFRGPTTPAACAFRRAQIEQARLHPPAPNSQPFGTAPASSAKGGARGAWNDAASTTSHHSRGGAASRGTYHDDNSDEDDDLNLLGEEEPAQDESRGASDFPDLDLLISQAQADEPPQTHHHNPLPGPPQGKKKKKAKKAVEMKDDVDDDEEHATIVPIKKKAPKKKSKAKAPAVAPLVNGDLDEDEARALLL